MFRFSVIALALPLITIGRGAASFLESNAYATTIPATSVLHWA
jgi:hypothetical protein